MNNGIQLAEPGCPRVAFCGPSRCGKDEAATYVSTYTELRFRGSLSTYLAPYVAAELGTTPEVAFETRHANREHWFRIGNQLRERDPLVLVKDCLKESDIVSGPRAAIELQAMKRAGLVSLLVWIDRDVPDDPTLEFGPEACDVIVSNRGSLIEFRRRLRHLFERFAGLQWLV